MKKHSQTPHKRGNVPTSYTVKSGDYFYMQHLRGKPSVSDGTQV